VHKAQIKRYGSAQRADVGQGPAQGRHHGVHTIQINHAYKPKYSKQNILSESDLSQRDSESLSS
jgi:hypothetical protein